MRPLDIDFNNLIGPKATHDLVLHHIFDPLGRHLAQTGGFPQKAVVKGYLVDIFGPNSVDPAVTHMANPSLILPKSQD
ncbi:MAG: hypothetical protein LW700_05830 [Gemmataceae bacterium]|nr:hypothetical protein [Gemmataceae bacterium]